MKYATTMPYIKDKIAPPAIPPKAPSTVFLGLNLGHSLCFPIVIPVKYANVSLPHALINMSQTKNSP